MQKPICAFHPAKLQTFFHPARVYMKIFGKLLLHNPLAERLNIVFRPNIHDKKRA